MPMRAPTATKRKPKRLLYVLSSSLGLGIFMVFTLACGVAQVQYGPGIKPPQRVPYIGFHAIPRAYGHGVCAVSGAHTHKYPPVPRAAFEETPKGFRDTRRFSEHRGEHPLVNQSCFRKGWHLHVIKKSQSATSKPAP